jgi:nucleotide-binding universal stress UspA family protein
VKPTVVVGYDHTPAGERALAEAGREAAWRGASVTVVHAFRPIPAAAPLTAMPLSFEESIEAEAVEVADAGADLLRSGHPGLTVEAKAVAGTPFEVLTDAARDAELLVVGSRGREGFADLLLGSVATRSVTHAPCLTLVVRASVEEERGTVIAAIDIEDAAEEILAAAFAEAAQRSARLKAISVWDISWAGVYQGDTEQVRRASQQAMVDAEAALKRLLEPWQAKYPDVRADQEAVDGSPSVILTGATTYADLIVAGAHRHGAGHDGVRLGPIADTLLQHADCPVLIVPRN